MRPQVLVDLFSRNTKQWPNDCQLQTVHSLTRHRPHSPEPGRSGAAKQIQEKSLHQIVRVMTEKNRVATAATRDVGEELVTRGSPRCLNRLSAAPRQSGDVNPFRFEVEFESGGKTPDELRIGFAGATAQLMIEMADDESPISVLGQQMEKRNRIAPTGHADEIPACRRKAPHDFRIEDARHAVSRHQGAAVYKPPFVLAGDL
jgi:hypothetical protein